MIHINLLPPQAVDQSATRKKELGLAGGILSVTLAAVLAVHSFQSSQLNEVNTTLTRLEGQVATIRKQNQEIEKLERQKKDLEEKIRVVNLLISPQRRTAPVHILDDLSSSTPEFLWLTEYLENKSVTQIRGKAIDNQTIASFAHNLSNSSYFRSVEIRETQQEAQQAPVRLGADKNAPKGATTPSVMMTKFLIEAAVNYGPSPESSLSPKESSPKQSNEENKAPAKTATPSVPGKLTSKE